jgi:serine/threonine-protein kinase ULK4
MRSEEPELYTQIGTGQTTANYQATTVHKGRIKNTIEFIAVKAVDVARSSEVENYRAIASLLDHPNIVKLHGFYQTSHHFHLLLEYCPGGTLLEVLENDTRLPEPIIRIFGADILAALLHMHKRGVLYRDLQPRNVMIEECGTLKLNDLSHAERLDEPFELDLSDPLLIPYMAPELFAERGVASFASDLWGFGCLLYQMAAGSTPFEGSDRDATVDKIHNAMPPPLANYTKDLNDLVHGLLQKDCFARLRWNTVIASPFWRDKLQTRPDRTFEAFSVDSLPEEPRIHQNLSYYAMEKRMSTIALPDFKRGIFTSRLRPQKISVTAMIRTSELLTPPSLIGNTKIEQIKLPDAQAARVPFAPNELMAADIEQRSKTIDLALQMLKANTELAEKNAFISFLINASRTAEIATALANCHFFADILTVVAERKPPSVVTGCLLLHASIVRNATNIAPVNLSEDVLAPLDAVPKGNAKYARRVLICVGEIAFYIASLPVPLAFPKFTNSILMSHLTNKEEITRHYALRAISNLLSKPRYKDVLDIQKVESAVINFELGADPKPLILDSFVTCLVMIYMEIETNFPDKVEALLHNLLQPQGAAATTKTIALILAAVTNFLPKLKPEIQATLQNATGELGAKALLACCIVFADDLDGFAAVSARFYSVLDKIEGEFPDAAEAIAKWTSTIGATILTLVSQRNDYSLVAILLQALPVKRCRSELWSRGFEMAFVGVLKSANFESPRAELLLQMTEALVYNNTCSVMIVTHLVQAINTSRVELRYHALKLIADATTQPKLDPALVMFIRDTVLPRVSQFMTGDRIVQDRLLKMLDNVANAALSLLPHIVGLETLSLIMRRVAENESAMMLAIKIVKHNATTLDVLVDAGLIDAIVQAMDGSGAVQAIDLLFQILSTLAKHCITGRTPELQQAIQKISPLASLAPKCADLMLDASQAGPTLATLLFLFTPPKAKTIPYAACFLPLGKAIEELIHSVTCVDTLEQLIKTMVEISKTGAAKDAMKKAAGFVRALKKLGEEGPNKLKTDVRSLLQKLGG